MRRLATGFTNRLLQIIGVTCTYVSVVRRSCVWTVSRFTLSWVPKYTPLGLTVILQLFYYLGIGDFVDGVCDVGNPVLTREGSDSLQGTIRLPDGLVGSMWTGRCVDRDVGVLAKCRSFLFVPVTSTDLRRSYVTIPTPRVCHLRKGHWTFVGYFLKQKWFGTQRVHVCLLLKSKSFHLSRPFRGRNPKDPLSIRLVLSDRTF